jgi:hypothetical protein
MICAREGRRKPESHALVCFRTLVVRVLRQRAATCASDAIARQPGAGSPCSWADSMRACRDACDGMRHAVRFGCCVEHGRRKIVIDGCAR